MLSFLGEESRGARGAAKDTRVRVGERGRAAHGWETPFGSVFGREFKEREREGERKGKGEMVKRRG